MPDTSAADRTIAWLIPAVLCSTTASSPSLPAVSWQGAVLVGGGIVLQFHFVQDTEAMRQEEPDDA